MELRSLYYSLGELTSERKTSDIIISDEIRNILNMFSDKSEIARMLLHRRVDKDLLHENHVNYIGMAVGDPSKISYLTPDRIEKIKQSPEDDFWTTSKRFACKPGSFVTKLFKNFTQPDIEKFSNLYKTFTNKAPFEFKIVSGEDIRSYYNENIHEYNGGSLGNSCMKSKNCAPFFDIYVQNPNVISMLIMLSPNDKLIGRALLWTSNSDKIMDRVYTMSDSEYQGHFFKWATDNGFTYKEFQCWNKTLNFNNGQSVEKRIEFQMEKWNHSYYPYLDTFKWLDASTGILSNYKPDHFQNDRNHKVLSTGCGSAEGGDYLFFDEIEREYSYRGDMVVIQTENGEITTTSRNCNWSDIVERFILRNESTYSEEVESYVYSNFDRNPVDRIQARVNWIESRRGRTINRGELLNYFNI